MDRQNETIRVTALWVRVDQNRIKLAAFVALFVLGSALLLDLALVAVPASLLGLVFAESRESWYGGLLTVWILALIGLLILGALASAVQLSNAEDWVRGRLSGRDLSHSQAPELYSLVNDMKIAAGLPTVPRLMVLDAPEGSVNALALGTVRSRALIGVTPAFLTALTADEQRAVVATLTARIVAGDIMFGTALAALMGPLKAIREMRGAGAIANAGCSDPGCGPGCGDGCADIGDAEGCGGAVAMVVFIALVAAITYAAVVSAAWIVTLWGRALHRTAYEKADAEGMLLLKDSGSMLSALKKAATSSNVVGTGDLSYDGIFYTASSGSPRVERAERRRYDRLREVLGTDGLAAPPLETR